MIVILLLGVSVAIIGQNKQVLFGFDKTPQTLLLNPGAEVDYKYHVGIPALSGISVDAGITGVTAADLFRSDGVDFTSKVLNAIQNLTANDYLQLHTQIDIINGGYKLNEKTYLSAGFYTEVDVFANIPKDMLVLLSEGNAAHLNRSFLLTETNIKADALGVLHAGVSRKINDKLTAGARLKIYSGMMNVTSTGNSGSFSTRLGQNSIYTHYLNSLHATVYSSGLYNENGQIDINDEDLRGNAFLGSNMGLGFDIGFTYKIDKQTEASASLLDVGFISYSNKIRNYTVQGDYALSGIDFLYDGSNPDYWNDLQNDLEANIPHGENNESYTVLRPIKFNSAIKYSWGRSRNEETCYDMTYKKYYNNAIGAQLFSIIRPIGPRFALTGFYEGRISESLNSKVTYTIDDFSYTNIGLGLSAKLGIVNLVCTVDNLFEIPDIANANNASVHFGINLLFK